MNVRISRRSRTLRVAAAALTAAALTLTACNSDEDGVRRSGAADTSSPSASTGGSGGADAGTSSGGDSAGADSKGSTGDGDSDGPAAGTGGGKGSAEKSGGSGDGQARPGADSASSGAGDDGPATTTCTTAQVSVKVSTLDRPVNHLMLQATNTSKKPCNAFGHPYLGFDGDQSTTAPFADSKPQAVVTLAPGETAYAGIAYSAADGSGSNPRKATTLRVSFAGPDQAGSVGAGVELPLPADLTVDDSARVTYWQTNASDAAMW
ncbi:DUF4232 domain-containing protein [Streptomyces pactum]|uniref:DUF4232 domain-containing protein n=1 Tax=Streptomyces pactum TaxID=68249 RepID=A0ABS0NLH0_9ACTN|nr:DUF4232 domain-containing protein [Streptomyces pactum]MBH5336038.1 DUF4232 domain-containing protein [Streptomyces pactum]